MVLGGTMLEQKFSAGCSSAMPRIKASFIRAGSLVWRVESITLDTGHVIRDLASSLFAPNPLLLLYLFADDGLLFGIFPKTVEHIKTKYVEKYEAYAKATQNLLVPGVY
jgi:hypothetical protein